MGEFVDLPKSAGLEGLRVYQALPATGRGPMVVLLQEIFGVNVAIRSAADDLAANGFVVLAPDLFWRIEPGLDLSYDEAGVQRGFACWKGFDLASGVGDVAAVIEAARTWPQGTGKVGVVGFCLGGQLAVKAGLKARADAVVSFYGVQLGQSLDEIADLGCPAQFHYGDADQHVPAETRAAIDGLARRHANIASFTYPGAVHAFFNSFRPQGFDPAAYDQSRTRMLAMLQDTLR